MSRGNFPPNNKGRDVGDTTMSKEKFVGIGKQLLLDMGILTNSSYRLFTLLLLKIDRKHNREPIEKTNPFLLKYNDFLEFGIAHSSFKVSIKELIEKGFIEVSGAREKRMCKIIKW